MIRKPKSKKTAKRKVLKIAKSFRRNPEEFEEFEGSSRFSKSQHAKLIRYLQEYLEYNKKLNSENDIVLAINKFFQSQLKFEFDAENPYFEFDYMLGASKNLAVELEKIINDFEKGKPIQIPKYELRFD